MKRPSARCAKILLLGGSSADAAWGCSVIMLLGPLVQRRLLVEETTRRPLDEKRAFRGTAPAPALPACKRYGGRTSNAWFITDLTMPSAPAGACSEALRPARGRHRAPAGRRPTGARYPSPAPRARPPPGPKCQRLGARQAHRPWQQIHAAQVRHIPQTREHGAEGRAWRGQDEIGGQRQRQARAEVSRRRRQ